MAELPEGSGPVGSAPEAGARPTGGRSIEQPERVPAYPWVLAPIHQHFPTDMNWEPRYRPEEQSTVSSATARVFQTHRVATSSSVSRFLLELYFHQPLHSFGWTSRKCSSIRRRWPVPAAPS